MNFAKNFSREYMLVYSILVCKYGCALAHLEIKKNKYTVIKERKSDEGWIKRTFILPL